MIRMLSDFKVKSGDGTEKIVPVMYGDMSRQVVHILKENSENKVISTPRIAVYIQELSLDKSRLSDSSFISKLNINERDINDENNTYANTQGQNWTVERIMPVPYTLRVKADIWSSNTEQKLQILEQILVLFNPSLDIQTTDNYVDWTSLTAVYLDDVSFSNRSIPVGVESDIDIATLTFETPIYLSAPAKIKRLGVIETIIANIFKEPTGDLNTDFIYSKPDSIVYVTPNNFGVMVIDNTIRLLRESESISASNNQIDVPFKYGINVNWYQLLDQYGKFYADRSRIYLRKDDNTEVVGTVSINPNDETLMMVNWDPDTFPTNTVVAGRGTVDAIIDPQTYNPGTVVPNIRYLILSDIVSKSAGPGPSAWKNSNDSDFIANANDIIEWDGEKWNIVFNSLETVETTYITNQRTRIQYKWDGENWIKSFEGEYTAGWWRLVL